ncbi:MAG: hypothetical protein SOZ34_02720 [Clostridia bacterium]|nr:hypothetical protein [Clostridia bacterium]
MFKKILSAMLITAALITAMPMSGYAFSNTISLSETGTSNNIIYIKRPESHSASTSDKTYTISAVGAQGTKIKVYRYNPQTGNCGIIKNETYIGASGLYSVVVDLTSDSNIFVVTAENSKGSQAVRIDIDKIKKSTIDRLKNVTVTIRNFIG